MDDRAVIVDVGLEVPLRVEFVRAFRLLRTFSAPVEPDVAIAEHAAPHGVTDLRQVFECAREGEESVVPGVEVAGETRQLAFEGFELCGRGGRIRAECHDTFTLHTGSASKRKCHCCIERK